MLIPWKGFNILKTGNHRIFRDRIVFPLTPTY